MNDAEDEKSLSDLMRRAQDGDRAAYADLLRNAVALLRRFVRRRVQDGPATEDIVQEILLSLHQARHTYDPAQPFRPWLFGIGRYKLADYWRRVARQASRELPYEHWMSEYFDEWGESLPEGTPSAMTERLQRILKELPEIQQKILFLLKEQDLSVRETAKKLGMSEAAVKTAAHRAYKMLRQRLEALNSSAHATEGG